MHRTSLFERFLIGVVLFGVGVIFVLTLSLLGKASIASRPNAAAISLTGKPHLIMFYADWCGWCQKMRPSLNLMKEKYGASVTFWDLNIDSSNSAALSRKYSVYFVPYVVLLDKEGETMRVLPGYQTQKKLEDVLTTLLIAQ
ncbi:MAG TPA: thioredoxin domain-containing protein [Aggregatilineales bacterium]|nr:thioredoxin domain-containing protein [Aggregatilineales bacterium]